MLSVFITPCTKPTRIQCATSVAVRRQTSSNQRAYVAGDGAPSSGKCVRDHVVGEPLAAASSSCCAARISKLPKRTNDGATRQTTAPGSACGWPS